MQAMSMSGFGIVAMTSAAAQQEDFFSKQKPLILCLDSRNQIAYQLTFDTIEHGMKTLGQMMRRYFDRFNGSYHYGSAETIEHDTFHRPFTVMTDAATGKAYLNNRERLPDLVNRLKNEYLNLRKRYAGASSILTAKDAWVVRLKRSK